MTDDWCKQRLIGYKFNGGEPVNEEWAITSDWIPFGRRIQAVEPDAPKWPIIGSWGFFGSMSFWGSLYLVAGG